MTKVKGTKITSKVAFLKVVHGDDAAARVVASMSAEDQQTLRFILDVGWYPQDLYERLLKAICRTVAAGDADVYRLLGRHSAEHQFSHAYRAYNTADLAESLQNMVPVHARMNDPGAMEVSLDGSTHATILVTAPPSSAVICAVSRAFYERVVELHGGAGVKVEEPECSGRGEHRCRYELSWRPSAG
jgi:hypothetical protein